MRTKKENRSLHKYIHKYYINQYYILMLLKCFSQIDRMASESDVTSPSTINVIPRWVALRVHRLSKLSTCSGFLLIEGIGSADHLSQAAFLHAARCDPCTTFSFHLGFCIQGVHSVLQYTVVGTQLRSQD